MVEIIIPIEDCDAPPFTNAACDTTIILINSHHIHLGFRVQLLPIWSGRNGKRV
jgi:hypothetical protein